jgi:hypothetical protein
VDPWLQKVDCKDGVQRPRVAVVTVSEDDEIVLIAPPPGTLVVNHSGADLLVSAIQQAQREATSRRPGLHPAAASRQDVHTVFDYDDRRQTAVLGCEDGQVTFRVGLAKWIRVDPDTAAGIGMSFLALAAAARDQQGE